MPANPIWGAFITIVGKRVRRLLHQVIIEVLHVSNSIRRITHSQVNTGRIQKWKLILRNYCEGPGVIRKQRVSVGNAVVEILIVDVGVKDRDCALFPKLERCVWRDVITLEIIVGSYCCAVVLT